MGRVRCFIAIQFQGIVTFNQTVLLAGINDTVEAQQELCERLFSAGVIPYYLHVLDKVTGAAHFDLEESVALALHRELQARLPGYLVPRLVKEVAGAPSKLEVASLNAAE